MAWSGIRGLHVIRVLYSKYYSSCYIKANTSQPYDCPNHMSFLFLPQITEWFCCKRRDGGRERQQQRQRDQT